MFVYLRLSPIKTKYNKNNAKDMGYTRSPRVTGVQTCALPIYTSVPETNDSLYDTVVGLREISVIDLYILDYKFDLGWEGRVLLSDTCSCH